MSTPLIWILLPIAFSILLIPLQKKRNLATITASLFTLGLSLAAFLFPEDLVFVTEDKRVEISSQILILGRTVQIYGQDLILVGLLYLSACVWNIAAGFFEFRNWFNTLSLIITALWITTLSVQPFLYAAVVVELITLLSVPLISPRGEKTSKGLLYFLVLQTLAMPLILLSGWMLSGIETAPSASPLIVRAAMMVIFGFVLWLAVYPFHSWVSMLAERTHMIVFGFLISSMQTAQLLFFLEFLDQYSWFRNLPNLYQNLQIFGALLIGVAGLLCAFQSQLTRVYAYFFLAESGYSILTIGLIPNGGLQYFAMLFLPRIMSYWLFSWGISALREMVNSKDLPFTSLVGMIKKRPVSVVSVLLSELSLLGIPLLPLFPVKQMIWYLSISKGIGIVILIILGVLGLLVSIIKQLRTFSLEPYSQTTTYKAEPLRVILPIGIALLLLLTVGLLPHVFLPPFVNLLNPLTHLLQTP